MTDKYILDFRNSESLNTLFSIKETRDDFHISLKKNFKYLIGYHATKKYDFSRFDTEGIIRSNKDLIKTHALNIFKNDNTKDDKEKLIENIIDNYIVQDEMKINFSIDKNELLKDTFHYLLLGSEILQSLANQLTKEISKIDSKAILKNSGKPIILKCKVPLLWIKPEYLNRLYDLVQAHERPENILKCDGLDFAFSISSDLLLENIIDKIDVDINEIAEI